ncbi:MAG: hypothetical protein M3405_11075 [Acidobacteriota bacterium]|nr:hypothetical protein [Acidobacteriota bacterium]
MPPSAIGKNLERKDWKKVDNKYKEIILNAVSKEQNSTNKPVFLCKKFLIRKLPGKEWKIQKLPKLYPKTNKAILKYSETREQFALRRVNYYEKYFREIRIVPTFCKFYTLASVNPRIFKKYPKLEKSIKHSLNALEQDKQKGWV